MKKTATEIASQVLAKLAESENPHYELDPPGNAVMKGVGTVGGGVLGGLFGGAAGAGLGSAIRSFPGYEPTSRVGKALSKTIQNPVGRGIATALPYLGLGTGMLTGARKGHQLFNVGSELTEDDVRRILEAYAQRVS
jgi:hypothetical protein